MIPRHKFNAVRTEVNGISFPSKREARCYADLELRRKAGDVLFFLRQVPFHLPGNVVYRVDFATFNRDGTVHFIDAKGMRTQIYIAKKKMVEALFGIEIEEV